MPDVFVGEGKFKIQQSIGSDDCSPFSQVLVPVFTAAAFWA